MDPTLITHISFTLL